MSRKFLAMALVALLGACAQSPYGRTPVNYVSAANSGFADAVPPAGPRALQWLSPTGGTPMNWQSGGSW